MGDEARAKSSYQPSDDEQRCIAYLRWRATARGVDIDSQISLEGAADEIEQGRHHHD